MISRRRVASYLAEGLVSARKQRVDEVAAWLVGAHKTRTAGLIARDVAELLARDGYVTAIVTTARPLSDQAVQQIEHQVKTATGATTVELARQVDPDVIGGLKIELPDAELDATVRTKLTNLVTEMAR